MTEIKKILFVCVENAGRSQMAEAFFKKHMPVGYQVISAGTRPATNVNPLVSQVMKEVGINIEKQIPKSLSSEMLNEATITVNMGCMDKESCPALFVKDLLEWNIPDPKGKSIEEVRRIRDQIETKVIELVKKLQGYV